MCALFLLCMPLLFLHAPPGRGRFLLFFFWLSHFSRGLAKGRRSLSLINGYEFWRTITRCRKRICVFYYRFVHSKHPSDVSLRRRKGTLRQTCLSRGTHCIFLKVLTHFLNNSNHYTTSLPAPQTDSSSGTHSHHKKLLHPWSLPEKCWTSIRRKGENVWNLPGRGDKVYT